MKKILLFPLVSILTISLYGLDGTAKVDEVLRQLTKQYESEQASKSKLERDKFELDAKTAELNNKKTIGEILNISAIIKVDYAYIAFIESDKEVFVKLTPNSTYKDIKIIKIDQNGIFYNFKGDSGYLPLSISARVMEMKSTQN